MERFGIQVTLVEPGFFRTDLLAPQSVVFGAIDVEGYDSPAAVEAQWQSYALAELEPHRHQSGDPAKLGKAGLVQLAGWSRRRSSSSLAVTRSAASLQI